MLDERLARMTGHARRLADEGQLRPGMSEQEARDVLWLYSAPEWYDLLVLQRAGPRNGSARGSARPT
jgi:hypothetical protein